MFYNPYTDFKAQYINDKDKVEDLFVPCRTAFICLENKTLKVKELNGDITTYELVTPLDEKDLRIKELESELDELRRNNETNSKSK